MAQADKEYKPDKATAEKKLCNYKDPVTGVVCNRNNHLMMHHKQAIQQFVVKHQGARAVKGRPFVKPNRKVYTTRKNNQLYLVKQLEEDDEESAAEFERTDDEDAYCVVCAQIMGDEAAKEESMVPVAAVNER